MRRKHVLAIAAVLAFSREAHGEIYRIKSPSTLKTEKDSELKLPPGYFLDEKTWQERDLELKEAQEARTRLKAENDSLRKSANEYPWLATGVVGAFGVLAGIVYMATK
jgi:hypothetical protein